MSSIDSVDLEIAPKLKKNSIKQYLILFIIFIFVVSDIFINNILSNIGNTVKCRTPTNLGVVVQGIFLVIFYIISVHLVDNGIL
jgi:hypothetical protein